MSKRLFHAVELNLTYFEYINRGIFLYLHKKSLLTAGLNRNISNFIII